jgi:hypothetical protein
MLVPFLSGNVLINSLFRPIWWWIIDASDSNIVQDFVSEEEFLELNSIFSSAFNIGHPKNTWTVLEPVTERCLTLKQLDPYY